MADKRTIGRELSRLESHIDDPDAGDRVDAYWSALADAVRDAESGDGDRTPADLPDLTEPFPVGYDRDDIMDAFAASDATWGDAVKRAAERCDQPAVDPSDGGDTTQ
jgi:hypothetical protein